MTVAYDASYRSYAQPSGAVCLDDKFEVIKDIGDGSFGSVAVARVRSAGAHIARRNTMVAIKTMKKTFDSFNQCLDLREVIFLKTLPNHPHLVPALDIFLDPLTKKLHIAMEYMDGNLYQLMKSRDHKQLDPASVKSVLFQIISGLEHIHDHHFFHRDIKPENILVSTSSPQDSGSAFKRYSALVTPPSTPPAYTIKIADFGLARETHSKLAYTTYVSTRWYRAPEVLLRAGQYSAPVDIWAIGAMAVEIATLKPLFPGSNEVDQVWRVCEIMGSPGAWVNKQGVRVGGGEWKEGVKLAQKLGFQFPKMAPHSLESILQPPQWPSSLAEFVTWCLMWDPKARPTSRQALEHEYFQDAIDPLRPKTSSSSKLLGRKHADTSSTNLKDTVPGLSAKTSWFRKSYVARESAPTVPQPSVMSQTASPRPTPVPAQTTPDVEFVTTQPPAAPQVKAAGVNSKRATWANGLPSHAAPIPILPSIRPISPLSNAVTAQAKNARTHQAQQSKQKIGRQLSVASQTNHYADIHRQEAERALNGQRGGVASPASTHREGFFSHLRKRARRLSGKHQAPPSPNSDDIEANAGCAPWSNMASNRGSMIVDSSNAAVQPQANFTELDKALQNVRSSMDQSTPTAQKHRLSAASLLKRHNSNHTGSLHTPDGADGTPPNARARRPPQRQVSKHVPGNGRYETPNEEEELLDEALLSAHTAASRMQISSPAPVAPTPPPAAYTSFNPHSMLNSPNLTPNPHNPVHRVPAPLQHQSSVRVVPSNAPSHQTPTYHPPSNNYSYLTPSPSANGPSGPRNMGLNLPQGRNASSKPVDIVQPQRKVDLNPKWPTPPYDDDDGFAATAAASLFNGPMWR
ncbi:kinase-like protein [Eremomyces bilateralis CBS 781.70]|uniref:Kinase-like protein n=1 Tax=Eremomyces bilateralis CBS 781.70 TaxID=1392243 RepID=A0A6G1GGQ5_9PEZI|nr:kinase-like protein [Eremomyces bilateralis CBS 781.70]KAF1817287.1 kinase-like protein [Eremomyces bilateralis CBS 781.70]